MLFQKKQDYFAPVSAPSGSSSALGQSIRFAVTREFPIESMFLLVSGTFSDAATDSCEGVLGLIKRVQVTVSDGTRTRNVIDTTGQCLIEFYKHTGGMLSRETTALLPSPTTGAATPITGATFNFSIPIPFCLPNIDDPLGSALLLPADRFNNDIQVNIQLASVADLDLHATPTVALTGANLSTCLQVNRRIIDRIKWPILDTELFCQQADYAATGANYQFEVPITGNYTGILLRTYRGLPTSAAATDANVRGDISVVADYGGTDTYAAHLNGSRLAGKTEDWDLRISGNVLRRFRLADIERENDYSEAHGFAVGDALPGSYYLDFVADRIGASGGDPTSVLGSLLNANIPLNSGTRIYLRQNIQQASCRVFYVFHRIFGNLAEFKI